MKGRRVAAAILLPALLLPAGALRAATPTISHEKLTCIPADNSKIVAEVTSPVMLTAVRVYFRSTKYETRRYVEARKGVGNQYWAILPIPKAETDEVEYQITAVDEKGDRSETEKLLVEVKSCDMELTDVEKTYARNLVIGLTDDDQDPVPEGFKCTGIISKITVEGVLKPHDECAAVLAVIPPGVWVAAGAAAIAGGTIIVTDKDDPEQPLSPSRPAPPK